MSLSSFLLLSNQFHSGLEKDLARGMPFAKSRRWLSQHLRGGRQVTVTASAMASCSSPGRSIPSAEPRFEQTLSSSLMTMASQKWYLTAVRTCQYGYWTQGQPASTLFGGNVYEPWLCRTPRGRDNCFLSQLDLVRELATDCDRNRKNTERLT